ncbi:MAG: carboxypeptidase regulatory-like domain-containing protein [Fibrobacteres bacterium]|nr:carboxypeptidase regulatory-like domain-containing protein [Fibrobacterota bacterium]
MRVSGLILSLIVSMAAYSQTAVQFNSIPDYYVEINKIVDSLIVLKPDLIAKKIYGTSTFGRECFAVKISDNVDINETEPEVGFDAGTHADEWVAMAMANNLMRDLIREYDTDSTIKALVDSREIWIYPKVFMDGNSRLSKDGININRDWGFASGTPFQSQHTIFAARWMLENRFVCHWTGHDGVETIGWHSNSSDVNQYKELATRYHSFASYLNLGYGYASAGWTDAAAHGMMGTLSYLVEVHGAHAPARVDSIAPLRYLLHKPAMLEIIKFAGRGVWGIVTDGSSGEPVSAEVWVEDVTANRNLRHVFTHPEVGDYHKCLLPGQYKVRVTANGYVPSSSIDVTVADSIPVELNFKLVKSSSAGHYACRTIIRVNTLAAQNERSTFYSTWKHLGAPDGQGYHQGKRGYVVVDMGDIYHNLPDTADLAIFDAAGNAKGYKVEIAADWIGPWTFVGIDTGTATFDINESGVDSFRYIKVSDMGDGDTLQLATSFCLDAVEAFSKPGGSTAVSRASVSSAVNNTKLSISPNPTNGSLNFSYYLHSPLRAEIRIYSIDGRLVYLSDLGPKQKGMNELRWNGRNIKGEPLSNGMYTVRLKTGNSVVYSRMLVYK